MNHNSQDNPSSPEKSDNKNSFNQDPSMTKDKTGSGISLRNKLIVIFSTVLVVLLIAVVLLYLRGGSLDILADQVGYLSQDPGKATSNLFEHGNIKGQSGRVCGIVRSQYNSIIPGAKIQVTGGEIDWSTQTDQTGQFCIPPLDREAQSILGDMFVGEYQLRVSAPGYNSEDRIVNVASGEEKDVRFYLSLSKEKMLPSF